MSSETSGILKNSAPLRDNGEELLNTSNNFGENNFHQKAEMMEKEVENRIGLDDLLEAGTYLRKFVSQDLPKLTHSTYKAVKSGLTPGFIKRMRRKKVHLKYVDEKEQKLDNLHESAVHTMAEEKKFTHAERERAKLIAEFLKFRQQVKDEEKVVIEAAKSDMVEKEFQEFHRRREEQLKEKEARLNQMELERLEKIEKEEQDLRNWRVEFYGNQAKTFGEEAANLSPAKVRRLKNEESMNRLKNEFAEREQARIRMQVENAPNSKPNGLPPGLADKVLYGFERKEYQSIVEEKEDGPSTKEQDLIIEEIDDSHHDVHLFDSKLSNIAYEQKVVEEYDITSALQQQEGLYRALEQDIQDMKLTVSRMYDMKELLEKEQRQIAEEILSIEYQQDGPPKRLAMSYEIPAMDIWKRRAMQMKKSLQEVQYAIEKANFKKEKMTQQSLNVAKVIANLKEKDQKIKQEKGSAFYNEGNGNLPMIIGRSISKVPGMNVMANAGEFMTAVVHKSRLINMKAESEVAINLRKENIKIDQEMWIARQSESSARVELESMISRIAAIGDKLQKSKLDNLKLNIVDALKGFLASGIKLHNVKKKLVGIIPWYKHQDPISSINSLRYITNNAMGAIIFDEDAEQEKEKLISETISKTQTTEFGIDPRAQDKDPKKEDKKKKDYSYGVTLGNEYNGVCCGSLLLPKDSLWIISVTITKQGQGEEYKNIFEQDSVVVKFGPTQTSLQTIATYYNRINPQTGTVLYDLKYVFRGNALAYRFEFHSLTNDTKRHLAVCTGIYEEYEIEDLEKVSDPKDMKKTRVLSSYVKMIRMEEKKGKLRETKLLEELIDVENSNSVFWDSQTLNFTLQRYHKEYFLRILKAEILLQQQIALREREKQKMEEEFELLSQSSSVVNDSEIQQNKLQESEKRYVSKKRAAQQYLITQAEEIIGKRIILWDNDESKWRNLMVNDVVINWIDNGLVVSITHKIQEFNDINEPIGKQKEINLNKFKFFISPIQEYDEKLIQKLRDKLKWEREIAAIEEKSIAEQEECDNYMKKYQKKSIKYFKSMKEQIISNFEQTISEKAEEISQTSQAIAEIRDSYFPTVLLDIRKGLVEVNIPESTNLIKRQQIIKKRARVVALERFIHDYIEKKRKELESRLALKEKEMEDNFREKEKETEKKKLSIKTFYEQQIATIKKSLYKQYLIQKNKLVEQCKFPKDQWQKVLPISFNCEHLRTKAWGSLYDKGVRCLHCGKELSKLYLEESQILGYGSGGNRELFMKYKQHYENEENYRPKDNFELVLLEKERLRLEKERREIESNEQYFYDFQDLQVIYEFDRRHAKEIKSFGIFRQGLQWTKDELEIFEQKKLVSEEVRLRREGLPEALISEYDPLAEIQNPPPTFRASMERHYSQYKDLLYFIGRLHNYQKKIKEFKLKRFNFTYEKRIYSYILEFLHKESYQLESKLVELESDLDRTSQLLAIYAKMEKLWMHANMITNQAKRNKMKIEMNQVYYPYEMKLFKDQLNLISFEMKNLLKTKILTENSIQHLTKEVNFYEERLNKNKDLFEKNFLKLQALKICMPGNIVPTKHFGMVYIISYRSSDDMLLVNLPFGKPNAKGYLYYKEVVEILEKLQLNEMILMEKEDLLTKQFNFQEKLARKKELYLMKVEDESCHKYYEFIDLNRFEKQMKQDAITLAVNTSFEITESVKYYELQTPNVLKKLDTMKQDRERRKKDYIGPSNNRPKSMSIYERYKARKDIEAELKEKFINKMANDAELSVKQLLVDRRSQWMTTSLFTNFIDSVINEMIYEISYESIKEGKEAKLETEKKTGIFFPHYPSYLSYGTYNLLSNLWQDYKNQLKESILLNESNIQKLILSLTNQKNNERKGLSNDRKKFFSKNPNYNNNKKLFKLFYDVSKQTSLGVIGGATSSNNNNDQGNDKIEDEAELAERKKKESNNYERKKMKRMMKKLKRLELERQQKLNFEMFQEELLCKQFYQWEMKENLRERRLMKEEEKLSLTIRKEEEKLKKLIAEKMALIQKQRPQGQAGDGSNNFELSQNGEPSLNEIQLTQELLAKRDLSLTYEKRRKELKDLTLERRRRAEDQRLMIIEDELSLQLREIDKIERQRKAYLAEFGADEEDEGKGENPDEKDADKNKSKKKADAEEEAFNQIFLEFSTSPDVFSTPLTAQQSERLIQSIQNEKLLSVKLLPIPDWMEKTLPKSFQTLSTLEKNKYLKLRVKINDRQKKIDKLVEKDEKRMLRLEKKSYKEWDIKYRILDQLTKKSELLMIETQEELYITVNKLNTIKDNVSKTEIFCREIGEKELKLKTNLNKLQEAYNLGKEEYQEACDWYNLCLKRNKNRDKLKRRVVSNCKFVDTESINGFYQRFETHLLRERIYFSYFQAIVYSIINRSEMIASERKLLLLQHALSENKYYLLNREKGMKQVLRELKCSEYMRMRRSLLNQTFFPKNRHSILSNSFKGWIRFYYWNRGNKNAYKLKFEILKRQLEIDRQFKKQLTLKNQYDYNDPTTLSPNNKDLPPPPSLMSRIRERCVQCKHCLNFYIASQNHSLACSYHPETYQLQCPETCPQPGLTALCSVHRKKRWGCCRITDQNAIGCARRYHTPPEVDPVYDYIMEKINERDNKELEELEEEVTVARQENYPEKLKMLQKSQLITIEKELEDARATAARFKNLKFV